MNTKGTSKRQNGLTVVEMLIIIAAIAVVVTISVPGSSLVLEHFRLKAASNDLVGSLNLAKEEAMMRGSTVRVCPSSNGRFCRSDGNWDHGWLVYSDGNGDGTVQEIEFVKAFDGPNNNIHILAEGAVKTIASFTITGLVPANDAQTGAFRVCHEGESGRAKLVTVDADGWVLAGRTAAGFDFCGSG